MKLKIFSVLILGMFVCNQTQNQQTSFSKSKILQTKTPDELKTSSSSAETNQIVCDGESYTVLPSLDNIMDKEFLNIIKLLPNKPRFEGNKLNNKMIKKLVYPKFENCFNRNDGTEMTWDAIAFLPTNGKFILLILGSLLKDSYAPTSLDYYIFTYDLSGNPIACVYINGEQEYIDSKANTDHIFMTQGEVYCLNTNRPITRKASSWNYTGKDRIQQMELEVQEIKYLIDENGFITEVYRKNIFPRQTVQWKDRVPPDFSIISDTVQIMLGREKK